MKKATECRLRVTAEKTVKENRATCIEKQSTIQFEMDEELNRAPSI